MFYQLPHVHVSPIPSIDPLATPEPGPTRMADPTRMEDPTRNPRNAQLILFMYLFIKFSFSKNVATRNPLLNPNGRSELETSLL